MIGWLGIVLTIFFGSLTMIQFYYWLIRHIGHKSQYGNLLTLKRAMMQLRAQYAEAVDFGGVIESKPQQQFIKSLGHTARTIEYSVDAMLKWGAGTKKQRAERDELFAACGGTPLPESTMAAD